MASHRPLGPTGRPFTAAANVPFLNFFAVQILNLGPTFSDGLLIHELTHAWQSQQVTLGMSANVQAFGRRDVETDHTLKRPASENLHKGGTVRRPPDAAAGRLLPC
jgi:hypothetical protein